MLGDLGLIKNAPKHSEKYQSSLRGREDYCGRNGVSFFTITCWHTPQNGRFRLRMRQSNSGR